MKLTVILSPNTKTGTTTVGNYLATNLAKKTSSLVLYIEFSKTTGRSLFFHGRVPETRRSITEVIYDPKTLQKQIIKSKYSEFLHFICMNLYEDFLHMTTYVPSSMASVISEASRFYEHIILDLPANLEEPIVGTVLSRNFEHRIDNFICVLDEDVLTAKLLFDLEALLKMGKESQPKELTYVVNKVTEHYIDYLEQSLNIGLIVPVNLIKLPYILEIKDCTNRSDVFKLGADRHVKRFYSGIDKLRDIVVNNTRGIGLDKTTMAESMKSINPSEEEEEDGKKRKKKKGRKDKKEKTPKKGKGGFLSFGKKEYMDEEELQESEFQLEDEELTLDEENFESIAPERDIEFIDYSGVRRDVSDDEEDDPFAGIDFTPDTVSSSSEFDGLGSDIGAKAGATSEVFDPFDGLEVDTADDFEEFDPFDGLEVDTVADSLSEEHDPFSVENLGNIVEGGE